jgi:hypothetical protein
MGLVHLKRLGITKWTCSNQLQKREVTLYHSTLCRPILQLAASGKVQAT